MKTAVLYALGFALGLIILTIAFLAQVFVLVAMAKVAVWMWGVL